MKIEIKHWSTGSILFEGDFSCLRYCVEAAVKNRASLVGASLVGASLVGANLVGANLDCARLVGANLDGANLVGANLDCANLDGANLVGASLVGANLDGAIYRISQVYFNNHGECGRMLSAVQFKKGGEIKFYCGCFTGTETELRKYIAVGAAHLRKTRNLALETSVVLLTAENESP